MEKTQDVPDEHFRRRPGWGRRGRWQRGWRPNLGAYGVPRSYKPWAAVTFADPSLVGVLPQWAPRPLTSVCACPPAIGNGMCIYNTWPCPNLPDDVRAKMIAEANYSDE